MGSEDRFKIRKARTAEDRARRTENRKPYDKVLIVCEGEKTEPFYFEEIRGILDLDSANIEIDGTCGSSPISVVTHAINIYKKEYAKNDSYDRVFCVFDRDEHITFQPAIDRINQINAETNKDQADQIDTFLAIRSEPSFEYWLLLHFTPTTKPYARAGKKSSADRVIDDLKKHYPTYKKKQANFYKYSVTNSLLAKAKKDSDRIYSAAQKFGDMNPSTNIHVLVEYLENLKN